MDLSNRLHHRFSVSILCLASALSGAAHGQVYSVTTPLTGSAEMSLNAYQGPGPLMGIFSRADFQALTETIYFDPINLTVRQVGSVSVTYFSQTNTRALSQTVGGQTVTAQLTTRQSVVGGTILFDTGVESLYWDSTFLCYRISGSGGRLGPISVEGSFSLDTGGENYSGLFSYKILDALQGFTAFATNGNPALLTLKGFGGSIVGSGPGLSGFYLCDPLSLTNLSANNGFSLQLGTGNASDFRDSVSWNAGSPTATMVPEPTGLSMVTLALTGWFYSRRRR